MVVESTQKLTRAKLRSLVRQSRPPESSVDGERRKMPRWPIGGTVELRRRQPRGERPVFATCRDLNESSIGVTAGGPFAVGAALLVVFYFPDFCLEGPGTVSRCTIGPIGFDLGIEFDLDG